MSVFRHQLNVRCDAFDTAMFTLAKRKLSHAKDLADGESFASVSPSAVTQVRRSPLNVRARPTPFVRDGRCGRCDLRLRHAHPRPGRIPRRRYAPAIYSPSTYSPGTDLRVPADEPRYAAIVMDAAS